MKTQLSAMVILVAISSAPSCWAQRPGGQRGGPAVGGLGRGADGGPPGQGLNRDNLNNNQQVPPFGNPAGQNQNANQGMRGLSQMAQMMIARFDADGSGELGQDELGNALMALHQMLRAQGGGQNQAGPQQQNGMGDNQNMPQRRQGPQGGQARGDRAQPPRGQGGARRGR